MTKSSIQKNILKLRVLADSERVYTSDNGLGMLTGMQKDN